MAGLLDIPEKLMLEHLFPLLGHNDLLRVRRVCKMTKDLATKYLRTPKEGHQGKWTLEIIPVCSDKNLQAFLQKQLPPPSRLHINLNGDADQAVNFFEDPNLEEFIRIYSKYVTHLKITRIEIPFTSAKEISFFESLVNLEELNVGEIKTGGAVEFLRKMETEGSCLIPSNFLKLKFFKINITDCSNSFWTFVHGLKSLESISRFFELHPCKLFVDPELERFLQTWRPSLIPHQRQGHFHLNLRSLIDSAVRGAGCLPSSEVVRSNSTCVAFLTRLIEEDVENKLKFIDWKRCRDWNWNRKEILQLFTLCSEKGIKIKGLPVHYLEVLLCNVDGVVDKTEIYDEDSWELVYTVDYQRNLFVANVVHSLVGLDGVAFLVELPNLEELLIEHKGQVRIWQRHGNIQWPNSSKIDITVHCNDVETVNLVNFLCGRVERPKLEEFALRYGRRVGVDLYLPKPCPSNMVRSFGNLRKLTIENCAGNCHFFATLWEGLRLLEHVELIGCRELGDKGFFGYYRKMGTGPIFLELEKLKHLAIEGIHDMPWLTNLVFWEVFRHMELKSLKLTGDNPNRPLEVCVEGIKALLTGKFAESIEKFDFEQLYLDGISEDEKRELKSRFRSSQML